MQYYYSSKVPDARGVIRIHAESCKELPDVLARVYLGIYPNGNLALSSVKEKLQLTKVKVCKCCTEQDVFAEN